MQLRLRDSGFNSQLSTQLHTYIYAISCNKASQSSSLSVNKVCNYAVKVSVSQLIMQLCNSMSDNYQIPINWYQHDARIAFNPLVSMVTVRGKNG